MRASLTPHLRWSRSIAAAGLLLVGALAFAALALGASPYALVGLVLVAAAVAVRRGPADGTAGVAARESAGQGRVATTPASGELEELTRAVLTVEEAIAALPGPDMSIVLHTIALQAQILTGARYVALGFGTDPAKPFDPWISLGTAPELARHIGRHPRPVGTLGRVACEGDVVRTDDLQRHPSFRGFPPGHPTMSSLLGVPIRYRGRAAGNLYLADKQGAAEFSEQDERMVIMLAARAAVAIETTRLYTGEAQRHLWLRNIIDQMPEGVLLVDGDGRTVAMNRALHAFLQGHAPDLLLRDASRALDVRFPDGRRVPVEHLPSVRALQHGETTTGRELVVCLGGDRLVPILANAAPVRDDQGRVAGAMLIVQDITALKDVERMREEWTSVIAHDLRQPVSVIALSAEAIERSLPASGAEKVHRGLARIRGAAQRLNRMIDDLLDASLLESKRMTVDCRPVDLGSLFHSVAEELDGVADGHAVRIDVAGESLRCWIDADRVRQILQNLISNAVKYGRAGSDIRVSAVGRDEEVEVAVTNEGPGIPPESLPNLFSRFMRTPEARAGRVAGLGLGLYITKGLVEAQRGRIWAESRPGESTTFRFTLPKAPPAEGSGRL